MGKLLTCFTADICRMSERFQIFKMEFFPKVVNGSKPLTTPAKGFILDVWQVSDYDYAHSEFTGFKENLENQGKI